MSAVELAVKKVKKLSARQAQELLGWLDQNQRNGKAVETFRSKSVLLRKQKFKQWHDSIRGVTDWEAPRMPDDLVKSIRL